MFHALAFSFAILVAGCAKPTTRHPAISLPELQGEVVTQAREQFREEVQRKLRLQQITDRLLSANVSLCNQPRWQYGFYHFDPPKLQDENPVYNALFLDYFGLETTEKNPVITSVRIGSGAQDAGLKKGDRILQAQDQFVQAKIKRDLRSSNFYQNKEDIPPVTWINTLEEVLESLGQNEKLSVTIQRRTRQDSLHYMGREERKVSIFKDSIYHLEMKKKPLCDNQSFPVKGSQINAYTDGTHIGVTIGALNRLSDKELALIIAHELAHCFEGHVDKKKRNALLEAV